MSDIEKRLDRIERLVIIAGKDVLNVSECALLLNRSESRIRHMVSERILPYYKDGGRTFFRKSEVVERMLQNRVPSAQELQEQAATYVATH